MSSETHINAFIKEAEEAYKEAIGAIDNFYQKFTLLRQKYEGEISKLQPDVSQVVKNVESEAQKLKKQKP